MARTAEVVHCSPSSRADLESRLFPVHVTAGRIVSRPRLVSEFTAFAVLELYLIRRRDIRMFGCLCMCLFHNNGVLGSNRFGHWCPDGAGRDIPMDVPGRWGRKAAEAGVLEKSWEPASDRGRGVRSR